MLLVFINFEYLLSDLKTVCPFKLLNQWDLFFILSNPQYFILYDTSLQGIN